MYIDDRAVSVGNRKPRFKGLSGETVMAMPIVKAWIADKTALDFANASPAVCATMIQLHNCLSFD